MTDLVRVFVYGTLMSGGRNAGLMAGAQPLGPAVTADAVWRLEQFNSASSPGRQTPALRKGGTARVMGEVWEVDAEGLARLDRLEQNGVRYLRELVALKGGGTAWAWVLIAPDAPSDRQDRIVTDPATGALAWHRVEPTMPDTLS